MSFGAEPLVLPAVDHLRERARRPALVVESLGLDELAQQADLVVGVEDGEVGFEPGKLGVAAQQLDADRVEGAEPRHALDSLADQHADALLHLARRLVGEGDGEDLRGEGEAGGEDVGDAGGEHARLAGAGAGQHQNRAFGRLDRQPLLGVQPFEIARRAGMAARAAMARAAMPPGERAGAGSGGSSKKGMSSGSPDIAPNVVIRGGKARSVSVLFSVQPTNE